VDPESDIADFEPDSLKPILQKNSLLPFADGVNKQMDEQ
jgi:hypothetical protein